MLPIDDRDWLEDFSITLSEREINGYANAIDETLVFTASKLAGAAALIIPGVAGSIFGGMLASATLWTSWISVFAYVVALPATWWTIRLLMRRLLGPAIQWQAVVLFFFTFLMGAGALFGAGFESRWWAYGLSGGMGLLLGLVYGSLDPTSIRNKDLWLVTSLPLGPVSTLVTSYLYRHASDPATLADVATAAGIGGALFAAPMAALLVRLWDNARGLRQLGVLYVHNDAFLPKSVDYLTRALTLAPDDVNLLNLRGLARSRLGELAGAEADWQRVLELDPPNVEPLRNRADLLLRQGSVSAARAILESAAERHHKDGPIHASLGIALARSGDAKGAMQHYDRAIRLEPRRPSTYVARAAAHLSSGSFDLAIEDCDRALDICGELAQAYLLRGHAYANLGEREQAAADYRDAIAAAADADIADEARRELLKVS